jgi:hypothetical protein
VCHLGGNLLTNCLYSRIQLRVCGAHGRPRNCRATSRYHCRRTQRLLAGLQPIGLDDGRHLETPLLSYTDYDVKEADGTLFKRVANGDEAPNRVVLPKGPYTVVAQSDTGGTISVPVTIESGQTTVVRLDGDANQAFAGIAKADLVRLPNGQAIGFRARHAMPLKTPAIMTAQSRISVAALKPSKS